MAGEFRRGVWTVLFGELLAAAAVLALSPKAREMARPYLMAGIRKTMELQGEITQMVEEARTEAAELGREIDAEPAPARPH